MSKNITRRNILKALAVLPLASLLPKPQPNPNQLYRATVDIAVQALNLANIAGLHKDGKATVEEVRAELAGLRAMVEGVMI